MRDVKRVGDETAALQHETHQWCMWSTVGMHEVDNTSMMVPMTSMNIRERTIEGVSKKLPNAAVSKFS
jgi:hypothetical protein